MMSTNRRKNHLLAGLACLLAFGSLWAAQESTSDNTAEDEKLLRAADVPVDGKRLLDFLRRQAPTANDEKEIEALFRQLDSASFKERQRASTELIALGPKMVPVLKRLLQSAPPLEVQRRAEACMAAAQKKFSPAVTAAAVRLVKERKPPGSCAALIELAPFASDDMVAEELLDALATVGIVKKQVEPALVAALRDPQTKRREIAGLLVGRFGTPDQRKVVGALLDDKDAAVRFRAAQGLIGAGTREALPILVESLRHAPEGLAELAEEILLELAGGTAPKIRFAADVPARDKCHQAWKEWLSTHQEKVDLSKVDASLPAGNPNLRARDVVRQLFDMALKPDIEKIRAITELPYFGFGQQKVITTRKQWEEELKKQQNQKLPDGIKLKFTTGKVFTLSQYLEKATPQVKEFLSRYPRSQVRVVELSLGIDFMGNQVTTIVKIFTRVNGTRARIIGTGPPEPSMVKMK